MHFYFKLVGTLIFFNLINMAALAVDCVTIADNTWDCGTPAPSDNLIVNHTVAISTVFDATGTITINSGGHLTFTESISTTGSIITVHPGGTLIIFGDADFGSNSSIYNQGTMSFGIDLTLGNSASLISMGDITVSNDVFIEQGSSLIIETGSTFHISDKLEFDSNDIIINGLMEVGGSFINNKSVTGVGQIYYMSSCDGLGTINGVSAADYCGANSVVMLELVCDMDTDDPVISNMPEGMTLYVPLDACEVVAQWTTPTATDNCSLESFTSSHNSGDFFLVGTTTVTYMAVDLTDNSVSASFDITVLDTISPGITNIPENITQYVEAGGTCGAFANWTLPTATDNCSLESLTSSHNSGDLFSIGTTKVTYTAVDLADNSVSASFDITVKDTITPRIINIPENITQYVEADGSCGAIVNWTSPTATNNCYLQDLTSSYNSGDFFSLGTTTVIYTLADNAVRASFDITIKDTISPHIKNIPENIIQYADDGSCGAIVNWTLPTATDNCSLKNLSSSSNSGDFFSVGTTTVTYTAFDAFENVVTASFNITVKDTISPGIKNIPENIIKYVDAGGSCGAIVNWTLPTATDYCSVSLSSSHNPGDFFEVGITTVTYTALDIHSNSTSLTFEVKVKDNTNPKVLLTFSDTTIIVGESIQLFAEGGVGYRWEPVDFLDNPEIPDPIASPTEDITYIVFMHTESGCILQDQVMIHISDEISYYIPEMFTPDGDGINDILFVNTLGYRSVDFKLFNRFGQLVFSTDDPNIGWDGRFNGSIQNPDTYVYTLALETFTNQSVNKKGFLQLVR